MPADDERVELHTLISRATQLVRQFPHAERGSHKHLRSQAQTLVQALDHYHPTPSTIQRIFGLLRQIADDDGANTRIVARAADALLPHLDSTRGVPRQRHASSSIRDTDAWALDMFRATESAIPRETLVADFVTRYRHARGVLDNEQHGGPWLFVFETETEQGQSTKLRAIDSAGVHPSAFAERCREHLDSWTLDPFLSATLLKHLEIDAWYAPAFGGSPLFDALLNVPRRFADQAGYWVSGVTLPGDGNHESRAVMILYANVGDALSPEPPPGIRQDMRLLTVLTLAWRQLEHQVRALARISEADRRDLINLIAPGLLHHEIGFNMRTAYGQLFEQHSLLERIAAETGRDDVKLALAYSHGAASLVLRLYRITDAFNNLDKRGQLEGSQLQKVLGEIKLLLHHRLGSSFTDLTWDEGICAAQALHTDVVLLSQALLNILNNALNALTEHDTPPPRRIRVIVEDAPEDMLALSIVNNGPEVPTALARDIFRRGYTTRAQGHGQGLYLARLVTHYLGGELSLLDKASLPPEFNVGFRFTIQRQLVARQGVSHVTN